MPVPILPIGVLLGKADTAFKLVGGSSIIFNALKSRLFGKVLRVVEYPDGDLKTVKIHRMNLYRLRLQIANAQPSIYPTMSLEPEDIKQVALFTSPHFTESVTEDSQVNSLPDNAWLFWSNDEDPIPKRGVKLDGSHVKKRQNKPASDEEMQTRSLRLARKIRRQNLFNRHQYDRVVDLAVDRDAGLLAIARNFKDETEFRHHSLRLLSRRDPQKIILSYDQDDTSTVSESDEERGKRNLEPQVELASRE